MRGQSIQICRSDAIFNGLRLIGRLFYNISGRRLNLRSLLLFLLFTFIQNLGYFYRFIWANRGHLGQNRGQELTTNNF